MGDRRAGAGSAQQSFEELPDHWRPPMPVREKLLVFVLALLVVFIGWGVGGIRVWSQLVIAGLGLLALLIAVGPGTDLRRVPWENRPLRRLLRFPLFWLGTIFLIYVVIQQLNPSWVYEIEGTRWRLRRREHLAWLPSGMVTPFAVMSGWRCLIWMGGIWLAVCAAWTGLRYRRGVMFLLWAAVTSATVLSVVGMVFKLKRSREILGVFDPLGARSFFGSFYYSNHAGAFLLLQLGLTLALAFYAWHRAHQRGDKSNPAVFLLMLALIILAGIYFVESRGTLLFALGLVGVAAITALVSVGRQRQFGTARLVLGSTLLGMATLFGVIVFSQVDFERVNEQVFRMARSVIDLTLEEDERTFRESSLDARLQFARPTLDMWRERPLLGFGLGSYQYYNPVHLRNYPDLYIHPYTNRSDRWKERRGFPTDRPIVRRLHFAHSDWLQSLAEVGLIGTGLLVAIVLTWVGLFLASIRRWHPGLPVGFAAFLFTFAYAGFEFVFWSPSVLAAFALTPVLLLKLLDKR